MRAKTMAISVKLYVTNECGSCEDVKTAIENKNYEVLGVSADLEMIDIENLADDFIFDHIPQVPEAQYGKRICDLYINEETLKVTIDCSKD
jgi:GTP:adenosylcobinamide-phosphate guanylyltransferase